MSLEVMVISTAIQPPGLTRISLSHFACSKQMDRLATRLSQSLRAGGAEQFRCIALFARHFTGSNRQKKALSGTLMGQETTIVREILRGGHTPKTKPTREGTAELLRGSGTAKPNCQRKPFALSEPRCHSVYGTQRTPRKYLELTHPRSGASRLESVIGKTSSDSLHGPDAWDANPWVAAISFDVRRGNIDEVPK